MLQSGWQSVLSLVNRLEAKDVVGASLTGGIRQDQDRRAKEAMRVALRGIATLDMSKDDCDRAVVGGAQPHLVGAVDRSCHEHQRRRDPARGQKPCEQKHGVHEPHESWT